MLDCADGAFRIGEKTLAESLRHRAARVAHDRSEDAVAVLADGLKAAWSESRTKGGG
jgi:hypothetical protein